MLSFEYLAPTRILFGAGKLSQIGKTIAVKYHRCLLVTTEDVPPLSQMFQRVRAILEAAGLTVGHFDGVISNPDTATVEKGMAMARAMEADCVLAVGGGSSMDTAKMIANFSKTEEMDWQTVFSEYNYSNMTGYKQPDPEKRLGLYVVPTTSGTGSQVTQAAVISNGDKMEKCGVFHPGNYPDFACIDPELMCSLPKSLTVSTAFDAFSHAFESYMNQGDDGWVELMALRAIREIGRWLPKVVEDGSDVEARSHLAFADTCAGLALANGGGGLPHPLGENIGGVCPRIPHGFTLAIVYPAYMKWMLDENPMRAHRALSALLGEENAGLEAFLEFLSKFGLSLRLTDFSVNAEEYHNIINAPVLHALGYAVEDLQQIYEERR